MLPSPHKNPEDTGGGFHCSAGLQLSVMFTAKPRNIPQTIRIAEHNQRTSQAHTIC